MTPIEELARQAGFHISGPNRIYAPAPIDNLFPQLERFAALVRAECQAWRPIETAPNDGTEFLAFKPTLTGPLVVKALDNDHPDNDGSEFYETWSFQGIDGFTHWMPLPPAPEGKT